MGIMKKKNSGMRLQDNKKGCRVKKNYSLMLYQRVKGDFYTINSEGKFTLSCDVFGIVSGQCLC